MEAASTSRSHSDSPRFYAHDIASILKDRNELKEKVISLEEEIVLLKKEIERLSNFGTLTLGSNAASLRKTLEEPSVHSTASGPEQHVLLKPQRACKAAPQYITDVEVTGYKRKGRYYVYVINLMWSDGQRYEVYRRYGEFFTFQHALLQLFPEQRGKRVAVRIIPSLPAIDNVFGLFGRTNTKSVMKSRLATINEYCQILLLHLDTEISQHPHVLNFFKPTIGDTQLSRLRKKTSEYDLSIMSVYPQDMPAGSLFEEYVVLADYEATTDGEISAKAGEKVKVIKKEESGWWLVAKTDSELSTNNAKEVGFISNEYLKPFAGLKLARPELSQAEDSQADEEAPDVLGSAWMQYTVVEDYLTQDPRQLSLRKDEVLVVLEKSEDGWWLAARGSEQGWVPASFLIPANSLEDERSRGVSSEADVEREGGEDYVAIAGYCGEHQDDISFPEGATMKVLEKSSTGWWVVRYKGQLGMAPGSFLGSPAAFSANLTSKPHSSLQDSMDMKHCISGIVTPPPRSKTFRTESLEKMRGNSPLTFAKKTSSPACCSNEQALSTSGVFQVAEETATLSSRLKNVIRSPLGSKKKQTAHH